MINSLLNREDPAHKLLLPFLDKTEKILQNTLLSLDKNATCRVVPAVDLGFPHDTVRIAGGFPTGSYVEWNCSVPFVPIDTTVNIDTSSIFVLSDDISSELDDKLFDWLRNKIENESSYLFNFHKGNHFISFGKIVDENIPVLVIHSNEKEFKYQFNGLMPSEGNWYMDDIDIHVEGDRYLRYLKGHKAELFIDIAKSLEDFNIIRHRFIANLLVDKKTKILSQEDHHHYFMPTRQSVAIGCFPIKIGERVPIFSRPGRNIDIFEAHAGGKNYLTDKDDVLVPHGWGKTCRAETKFEINYNSKKFTLDDKSYEINTLVSLGKDENLQLRNFSSDVLDENSLFQQMKNHCPGKVVNSIKQLASYTKNGFVRHK